MSDFNPLYFDDKFRLLYEHRLRWWRWVLNRGYAGLAFTAAMHLFNGVKTLGPNVYLTVLDTLIILLTIASSVIWFFVFRDPNKLLHFRRPSKGYRWAVYIISAANTVPGLILHIQVTALASESPKPRSSFIGAVIMLVAWLGISSVNLWMVHCFLLNESEEHYEPTVPFLGIRTEPASSRQSLSGTAVLEPSSEGHLSKAYALQQASDALSIRVLEEDLLDHGSGATDTDPTPKPKDSSAPGPSESTVSGSTDNQPTSPLRCRTVARFDYMCRNRIGPHSWLSYPLVAVILGISSTALFATASIIVYENNYRHFPSP